MTGSGQLLVTDSLGGGTVVLGGLDVNYNPITNTYAGGTTVLSGKLQVSAPVNGVNVGATALPATGLLTIGGAGQSQSATFDLNGQPVSVEGLVTASNLAVLNFATPGVDLLTIGDLGASIAANTTITLGTTPAATPGIYYDLIAGDANAASDLPNFNLVGASGFPSGS